MVPKELHEIHINTDTIVLLCALGVIRISKYLEHKKHSCTTIRISCGSFCVMAPVMKVATHSDSLALVAMGLVTVKPSKCSGVIDGVCGRWCDPWPLVFTLLLVMMVIGMVI